MGIYFIAAGRSSQNRQKTLDRPHTLKQIEQVVSNSVADRLQKHFPSGDGIYLWGANSKSFEQISQVEPEDYVIDVNMKRVMQVFKFAFLTETNDSKLQDFVGWDSEKHHLVRRPYRLVYFLKSPMRTSRIDKEFFQRALGFEKNGQWLAGQRYISELEVKQALERTKTDTLEKFLGLVADNSIEAVASRVVHDARTSSTLGQPKASHEGDILKTPEPFAALTERVHKLRSDPTALERDHEDVVAALFEILGYERVEEIKFQRGRIDIRIDVDGIPRFIIEVKADWSLTWRDSKALSQAYNYALQQGTRLVLLTNGDSYFLYDRDKGRSYSENFVGEFRLTRLTEAGLSVLNLLKKG